MTIAFQQLFTFTAVTPATSGSFTPGAANDLIGIFVQDGAGGTTPAFSGSGGGSWSNVGASQSEPGVNLSAGANLTETAAAQTATVTNAGGADRCWGFDYSGVVSVGSFSAVQRATPGTGAGAIVGTGVVVPSGSTLVALCIDMTAGTPSITAPAGTSRGSSSLGAQAYNFVEYPGSGASVTPAFTSGGGATDTFNVLQMLLTGTSGAGAVLAGAATDAITAAGALSTGQSGFAQILLDNASHVGGSDQIGMGSGPNTGTGDDADVAFTKLKQWAADMNTMTAQLYGTRSLQTPTTGFTIVPVAAVTQLILNPAGTLATGTVTFPSGPGDNQPFQLMTSQTITALTLNTSDGSTINGAVTTLSANTAVRYRFIASLSKWFREQ